MKHLCKKTIALVATAALLAIGTMSFAKTECETKYSGTFLQAAVAALPPQPVKPPLPGPKGQAAGLLPPPHLPPAANKPERPKTTQARPPQRRRGGGGGGYVPGPAYSPPPEPEPDWEGLGRAIGEAIGGGGGGGYGGGGGHRH